MTNAVIYARYSSSRQKEESIERQIEICKEYAAKYGMTIIGVYTDRAKTGKNDNRAEFQRMLYDSSRKIFEVVLVWKYDRFARNMEDHILNEHILKNNGVKLISAMEALPEGIHSAILKSVILGGNESYSVELSEKVKYGMKQAAEKGHSLGGHRILGYKVVDHTYVIDEKEAQTVRHIFEKYTSGHSMSEIVRELNAKGIKNSENKPFQISGMRRILENRRYTGVLTYKGEDLGQRIPAIIPEELFDHAQRELAKNKKAPSRTKGAKEQYLLTTKLFCGICGSPMSGVSGTSKTNKAKYQYYVCKDRYKHNQCSKQYVSKELLERTVVEVVKRYVLSQNIHRMAVAVVECCTKVQDDGTLQRLKSEQREITKAIENLIDMIENGHNSPALTKRLEQREAQCEELEESIKKEQFNHRIPGVQEVEFFFENFIRGDIESSEYDRYIIDVLVNSVYVDDNEDGTQKMTVLLNVQNGQETVQIDSIVKGSSIKHLVGQAGLEPATKRL